MTELKTLKDFHKGYVGPKVSEEESICDQYAYGLKAESIKWIKQCEFEKQRAFNSCDEQCIISQINWIKHFFNIKEEDLK